MDDVKPYGSWLHVLSRGCAQYSSLRKGCSASIFSDGVIKIFWTVATRSVADDS
jgi:hypothetical protein